MTADAQTDFESDTRFIRAATRFLCGGRLMMEYIVHPKSTAHEDCAIRAMNKAMAVFTTCMEVDGFPVRPVRDASPEGIICGG